MAAYFVSSIDRSILALLVDPIKHSLQLSDTQMGMLSAAFGVFFMIATLPAGWLADKTNRMRLVAGGITVWSLMTAACGLCVNFGQLFLARMGVAVGEASLQPSAPSVIADSFPVERRTLPLSVYTMGAGMGASLSLIAGGFVASLVGGRASVTILGLGPFAPWQVIFFAIGLPGLAVSLLVMLAREPVRREQHHTEGSFRDLWDALVLRRAVLLPHMAGACFQQVYAYGYTAWMPAFFMRIHHWSMVDVGLKYGAVALVTTTGGAWLGGFTARTLWRRGRADANLLTVTIAYAALAPVSFAASMVSSPLLAVLLMGITVGLLQMPGGPNGAALQEIMPNRLRARVTALYYAVAALTGMTMGPLVIGVMNDVVFKSPLGVGKSLSVTALFAVPGAALLYLAACQRRKLGRLDAAA
jgi:MFS family permease